jgi:uncharacterized protein YjbI with pentapeptide repeats
MQIQNREGTVLFEAKAEYICTGDLDYLNLRYAELAGFDFEGIMLTGVNLSDANLAGANFYCGSLISADLTRANLENANLQGCSLVNSTLKGANLRGVNLGPDNLGGPAASKALIFAMPISAMQFLIRRYTMIRRHFRMLLTQRHTVWFTGETSMRS